MTQEHGLVEPVRLKHGGVDLDDSAELGGYDLPKMRAAVDARVASGAVGTVPVALAVVAGVAVVAAAWWWLAPGPASLAPAPIEAAAVVAVQVAEAPHPGPVEAPSAAPPPARVPSAVSAPSAPPRDLPSAPVVAVDAPADEVAPAPVAAVAADGTGEASADPGDLAAQTAAYRAGQVALAEGRLADAAAAHRAYLERWPGGAYRDDALVSILDLAIRDGAWAHVEPLAAGLAQVPGLAARHAEFRRVRAEALVHLGRCDEALAVADSVGRDAVAAVRRTCRGTAR